MMGKVLTWPRISSHLAHGSSSLVAEAKFGCYECRLRGLILVQSRLYPVPSVTQDPGHLSWTRPDQQLIMLCFGISGSKP